MLDRPLVPKYSKASLGSISSTTSGISSASSKNLSIASQNTVTTVCTVPPKANGSTLSRASSAASLGRPYQTISDEPKNQRKPRSAPDNKSKKPVANKTNNKKAGSKNKKVKEGQRQWSADSGVDTTFPLSSRRNSYEIGKKHD